MITLASEPSSTNVETPPRCLSIVNPVDDGLLAYVYHPIFSLPGTEDRLFGPNAMAVEIPAWTDCFAWTDGDVPVPARSAGLKAAEEKLLFLRYNYARYRLARVGKAGTREAQVWMGRARQLRADLVRANMALVPAMSRRMSACGVEIEELIAEGNMALLRSVDRFDVSMGFKFSTYACRAILKSSHRMAARAQVHRRRFPLNYYPDGECPEPAAPPAPVDTEDSIAEIRKVLADNRAQLSDTEQVILAQRFSLVERASGKTLEEIGRSSGLSIERVRQILNRAMSKLRASLDRDYVAAA